MSPAAVPLTHSSLFGGRYFYSARTYLFRASAPLLSAARVQVLSPSVVHVRWMLDGVSLSSSCWSYCRCSLGITSRIARSAASSAAAAFSECRHATIVMQADILREDVHVLSDERASEEADEEALADGFWGSRGGPSMADEAAIGSETEHFIRPSTPRHVALKLCLIINPTRAICVFGWQTVCLRQRDQITVIARIVIQFVGTY
ncbi:uncharacterized protein LOC127011520 [Drosophila biarmipes]|uniref:uncharacterized protein LOC127011520 n=1 Tax=Drosophila biarmipes TaxID=125945 RepID=UPI0021CC8884|nr:uncharacterized protein LOC127011520 [Drosophila biarmipes]